MLSDLALLIYRIVALPSEPDDENLPERIKSRYASHSARLRLERTSRIPLNLPLAQPDRVGGAR